MKSPERRFLLLFSGLNRQIQLKFVSFAELRQPLTLTVNSFVNHTSFKVDTNSSKTSQLCSNRALLSVGRIDVKIVPAAFIRLGRENHQ